MPHGTQHQVIGTLRHAPLGFTLHVAGGGVWQVELPMFTRTKRLVGQRVIAQGVRAGFGLLDVRLICVVAQMPGLITLNLAAAAMMEELIDQAESRLPENPGQ